MIEAGTRIADKYRVERVLGRGGMGYVVQALHEQLAERVAIKFMAAELSRQPDAVSRFLREARAAFRIRSEHVARVLDVGEHEGEPFIVMELLSGHDLATEIAERAISASEAVTYLLQICEALAVAHALGIVHRDLKPSNLFLTRKSDGSALIKVLDFGISKALDDPELSSVDSLTISHRLLGSPYYMSPEQARAPRAADVRSDIWSLGVVLYELILAERPFRGDTPVAVLASLLSDTVPEITAAQRRVMPPQLMQVILRCLNRVPEQRFLNVAELASALLPMATPDSVGMVKRIESIIRGSADTIKVPFLEAAPASLDVNASTSTLRSAHISQATLSSATSTTSLLNPRQARAKQRSVRAKALALVTLMAGIVYWVTARGTRGQPNVAGAPSASVSPSPQRHDSGEVSHSEPVRDPLPSATESASASVPRPAPSGSAPSPTASPPPRPKSRAQPKTSARVPSTSSSPGPLPTKSAPSPSAVAPLASGPVRPSTKADPKNRPD